MITFLLLSGIRLSGQAQIFKADSVAWWLSRDAKNNNRETLIINLTIKALDYKNVRLVVKYKLPPQVKFKLDTLAITSKNAKLAAGKSYAVTLDNLPLAATEVTGIKLLYTPDIPGLTQYEILVPKKGGNSN